MDRKMRLWLWLALLWLGSVGAFSSRAEQYAKAQKLRFEEGDMVARKRAFEMLKALAAEESDEVTAQAAADLAQLYLFGDEGVVKRNLAQSHTFAQRSSGLANGQGSYILAFLMLSRSWPADGALRDPASGFRPPKEAIELLEASATRGYLPARMALAFRRLYGFEVPSNCESSLQLYKSAAEESLAMQGTIESIALDEPDRMSNELMRWLQHANVVEEEQQDYLFAQAKSGDASMVFELGVAMLSGRAYGIKRDIAKGIELLTKAAKEMNYAPAAGMLGQLFLTGVEVEMDIEAAMDFLEMGANGGDPKSMALLGKLLVRPDATLPESLAQLIPQDVGNGPQLLQAAAEYDEPIALYELAAHWRKRGDARQARAFYNRAVEAGYLHAIYDFAEMLEFGEAGFVQSCEQAAQSYKYVAESGPWVEGIREALRMIQNSNYETGTLMLSMAAEEGYEIAQYNAAWLLENRMGYRAKDRFQKALRYYEMAVLQNDLAHVELGRMKERGAEGVPADLAAAAFHYRSAYERIADQTAAERYARMLETGRGVTKDLDQARKIYRWLLDSAVPSSSAGDAAQDGGGWLHTFKRKTGLWFKLARNEVNRRMRASTVDAPSTRNQAASRASKSSSAKKAAVEERPSSGNLFFISDEVDGACLSVNGDFGDCTLDSLFSFHAAAVSMDGTAAAGFIVAPFVSNSGFLPKEHRFEMPFLVPMNCHEEISPLVAGLQSACDAGGWGVMNDRLVMRDGEMCMRRAKNTTAVLQPCSFGATPVTISSVSSLEAGGIIFQLGAKNLCLAGDIATECDYDDPGQRWGVQLISNSPVSFLQFYKTAPGGTSKSCLGVDEDGTLMLEECASETASRWQYDNGLIVFALDDDPYQTSSRRKGSSRNDPQSVDAPHVACVGLQQGRAILLQCNNPGVVRFEIAA